MHLKVSQNKMKQLCLLQRKHLRGLSYTKPLKHDMESLFDREEQYMNKGSKPDRQEKMD